MDRGGTKVLLVLLGLGTGGAERSNVDLAPYLRDRGIDLHIHCRGQRSVGAESDLRRSGVTVSFMDGPSFPAWVTGLRRTIAVERPDVVHTTLYQADLAGRLAAVGTGVPVLTSIVNESYSQHRRSDPAVTEWKLELTRRIEGASARLLTEHTHAITRSVAESCERELGLDPSRVTVIPRGREPDRLGVRTAARRRDARLKLGVEPDRPMLLAVGRQEFQKGHDTLLRAFAVVRQHIPDTILVLAGRTGGSTPELDQLIDSLDLERSMIRTGHVDDVAELFCAADVFVFPSRFEGLGGVLLEAMALETPIVASDIGPIRETVDGENGALLVPPDHPDELAVAIRRMLEDPDLAARLVAHGRDRFATRYSMERVADETADLYRSVAAAGRRTLSDRRPSRRPYSR